MRRLRAYICEGKDPGDAFRNETDALLYRLANFRKTQFVSNPRYKMHPIYTKIVCDGYMHAVKWEIKLPDNIIRMMETYMLHSNECGRDTEEDPSIHMFDAIETARYPDRSINGILFMRLRECDWTVRLRNGKLKVAYRYQTKYEKPERELVCSIYNGSVRYHGEIMHVGRITFSLFHHDFDPLCITKCRLYYTTYNNVTFGYHICTNTLYTSSYECEAADIDCQRARMSELWCLRYQLIRKMQPLIARVKEGNYAYEVIHNFL